MPARPLLSLHLRPANLLLRFKQPYSSTSTSASSSTVQTGTTYETLVSRSLSPLAFTLTRVGGRADRGIDLQGHWCPPAPESTLPQSDDEDFPASVTGSLCLKIPTIVQCKAHESTKPSPSWVRELSGAVGFAPLALRGGKVHPEGEELGMVGVLACKGACTPGVREAVMKSEKAVVYVQVEGDGKVRGMLWNRVVGEMVGSALAVGFVYRNGGKCRMDREIRLMREGKVWKAERGKEE